MYLVMMRILVGWPRSRLEVAMNITEIIIRRKRRGETRGGLIQMNKYYYK